MTYLYEQGIGQLKLITKAKDNQEVLKSVRVSKNHKEKIKKIEELKRYFYQYWNKELTKIYTQTTFLNSPAVTYLVISSPYNQIKAVENCFPFMGCFPYLGFFSLDSANAYKSDQEKMGHVTWLRPIYAYSTLGYFNDTILSSFFHYNDYDLAELIFHELFHTIFFVKNEVDLNESLANYFSERMLEEYFSSVGRREYYLANQKIEVKNQLLNEKIVVLTSELQSLYKNLVPKDIDESSEILSEFLNSRFRPEIKKLCEEQGLNQVTQCSPLKRDWNNASFAAFLTYEKNSNQLEALQKTLGLGLKEYYNHIESTYKSYQSSLEEDGFEKYLFKR